MKNSTVGSQAPSYQDRARVGYFNYIIKRKDIGYSSKVLLYFMIEVCDGQGFVTAPIEVMSDYIGASYRTTHRDLKDLEVAGVITKVQRNRHQPSLFWINTENFYAA